MSKSIDPVRLSKTLSYLLRHRPDVGALSPDDEGWLPLDAVVAAVGNLMHRDVPLDAVEEMIEASRVRRFEVDSGRIRAVPETRARPRLFPPDILYHAIGGTHLEQVKEAEALRATGRRPLYLSNDEASAWRVAHRRYGEDPHVLYVDTTRARRHGVRFERNKRTGLYSAAHVPLADILNLQPNFAEQRSSGGLPMTVGEDGQVRFALIRVTRRSGVTWEVAKGKLEPGETPESAGIREVREEMGIESDLRITDYVGMIRYGFLAPGGLPRLKSVYLFLMETLDGVAPSFTPRAEEGIGDVQWFTPSEAVRVVKHSSLKPIMRVAKDMIEPD